MEISKRTSPLYQDWLGRNDKDISLALEAINEKDMSRLENVTEENCNFMHEVMKTSKPPIIYMNDVTHSCVAEIENLRASGHKLFYTIDAGPQIKIICDPKSTPISVIFISSVSTSVFLCALSIIDCRSISVLYQI